MAHLQVFERSTTPPAFRLTDRDVAAIELVQTLRFVTSEQLRRACYNSTASGKTYAEYRLKLLYQHGYLARVPKPQLGLGAPKVIYCLDTKGRDLLAEKYHLPKPEVDWERWDNSRSLFFLEHTIALNELRLTLEAAAKQHGHELLAWWGERELRSHTMRDVALDPIGGTTIPIVPDGWAQLLLANGRRFSFFVELDRGTEYREQFTRKFRGYLVYWESGRYLKRYGTQSLTVLTVIAAPKLDRAELLRSWTQSQTRYAKPETFRELFWFTPSFPRQHLMPFSPNPSGKW